MRRILIAALAVLMLASFCACGGTTEDDAALSPALDGQAEEAEIELTPEEASESDAESLAKTAPASDTDADDELYELAEACIGRSIAELYDAIGEPNDSQYAASCEEDNAEDGMLYYDGFYVWTVRTESQELVRAVYPDE